MSDSIIIYTQESCVKCETEKQLLNANGIEYEERDIRKNPDYMKEVMKLGATATPVTVISTNGKKEIVMGFDKERLSLLLNI